MSYLNVKSKRKTSTNILPLQLETKVEKIMYINDLGNPTPISPISQKLLKKSNPTLFPRYFRIDNNGDIQDENYVVFRESIGAVADTHRYTNVSYFTGAVAALSEYATMDSNLKILWQHIPTTLKKQMRLAGFISGTTDKFTDTIFNLAANSVDEREQRQGEFFMVSAPCNLIERDAASYEVHASSEVRITDYTGGLKQFSLKPGDWVIYAAQESGKYKILLKTNTFNLATSAKPGVVEITAPTKKVRAELAFNTDAREQQIVDEVALREVLKDIHLVIIEETPVVSSYPIHETINTHLYLTGTEGNSGDEPVGESAFISPFVGMYVYNYNNGRVFYCKEKTFDSFLGMTLYTFNYVNGAVPGSVQMPVDGFQFDRWYFNTTRQEYMGRVDGGNTKICKLGNPAEFFLEGDLIFETYSWLGSGGTPGDPNPGGGNEFEPL
jgi:hypothetical protein